MCGFCNVWVCANLCFVRCGCVYVWVLYCVGFVCVGVWVCVFCNVFLCVYLCGFCNVLVCAHVGFVMSVCVCVCVCVGFVCVCVCLGVWDLQYVGVCVGGGL